MLTISRMGKLKQLVIDIRSSLWFVPTLNVVSMAALAIGLIEIAQQIDQTLRDRWPRLFAAEAEGSRAMLSAIAGSMITVAGVVFSITIVALTLASSQYTSRILRNFMRDRANQVVLGVFVGIYTYCLLVLRTISSGSNGAFIPSLAVSGGVVLALVGIRFFVFFIHHIAASIQASEIIDAITRDTLMVIDRLFPEELGDEVDDDAGQPDHLSTETTWSQFPPSQPAIYRVSTRRRCLSSLESVGQCFGWSPVLAILLRGTGPLPRSPSTARRMRRPSGR